MTNPVLKSLKSLKRRQDSRRFAKKCYRKEQEQRKEGMLEYKQSSIATFAYDDDDSDYEFSVETPIYTDTP